MLQRLFIQNYAIIEQQEIAFENGLNIITGETGAGKSILLGALSLVLGQRAESKVLFDKTKKAIVEATFVDFPASVNALLERLEFETDNQIILRREILPSGKSRAFINDSPARLEQMLRVTSELIDLHQQFEALEIQDASMQFRVLDAYGEHIAELEQYKEIYTQYQAVSKQIRELTAQQARALQEKDYFEFQMEELSKVQLEEGRLDEMEAQFRVQEHAVQIQKGLMDGIRALTEGDLVIVDQLREILHQIEPYAPDHKALGQLAQRLHSLMLESQDLSNDMMDEAERIDPDPLQKEELEATIDQIRRLMMKHGVQSEGELISVREGLEEKLSAWEAVDETLIVAVNEQKQLQSELKSRANTLSKSRKKAAEPFSHEVTSMLHELEMKNAHVEVSIEPTEDFTPLGKDHVEFLFASNLGSARLPIRKVASGGELSRLSLCIKSAVSQKMQLPTLVFDEIDAGVSGQVAMKMGDLLKALSGEHQLIMVTHSPQIASRATRHLQVSKRDLEHRSIAEVNALDAESRIHEIAKMLSGDPPTEAAVMNAKELINV